MDPSISIAAFPIALVWFITSWIPDPIAVQGTENIEKD